MGNELWSGKAQNGVNSDFEVKFGLEGQGQLPFKTIGTLTFCIFGRNLAILAWTGPEFSRGQASDWHTDRHTHTESDKGTRVRFCWVPSHCGIDGNEGVDRLARETLDQDIDPLASVHSTDMKPLVNSNIKKLVQTKWDVVVHGRDLYLMKPTLGPPKKFQHLSRAEEFVITRLRIGHTKATKSHILSRGPPTGCHHCGQTLTIDHMLLECALLQDEYYTVDSLNALFKTIPETCILEFLREAGFFYLIWCNLLTSTSTQTWTIWSDLSNCLENESYSETRLPL